MRRPTFGLSAEQFEYVQLILLAALVGVLGALGNLGFGKLIELCSWLFRSVEWSLIGIPRGGSLVLLIPVVLVSGGIGMVLLDRIFPGQIFGYGFPRFLEMLNLGNPRIDRRFMISKALGAALSLGSGASVGREGPIAQIGGAIGSAVAQFRRLSADRVKVLVAAGAGAGIATTFNAPIGGLMFAQEIVLLGHAELANLSLLIIATTSAVVTSRAIQGNVAVFPVPDFVLVSYWEMLSYALLGIALGLLSAAYIRFFHLTADTFRRIKLPQWAKLAIGLAIVGAIAIPFRENLSDGYSVINAAMAGKMGVVILTGLTFAKFFASSVSLGCGAPGGVFGPIFFIGAMAGGTFQRLSTIVAPGLTGPRGSYAIVALGGFMSGTTRAPMTALFLLFEMTRSYEITLPAMLVTILATVVARLVEPESIDTYQLAREGKTLQIGQDRMALAQIPVSAVMTKDVACVHDSALLSDVLHVAGETSQSTLPVITSEGDLAGVIVTQELLALLSSRAELYPLVNAYDLCRTNFPTTTPYSSLDDASQAMGYEGLDELPVVEGNGNRTFLGLVTREHIGQALHRVTVSLSSLATRDRGIYWATGYRVTRVEIPEAASGKTVRELDPRARFRVTLLAVQDADDRQAGFVPLNPDRRLRKGDLIVAAGRPADIRSFVRELEHPD